MRAPDFDLALSVECGQCFRWERLDGGYLLRVGDRTLRARQRGDALDTDDDAFARRFFALDHPIHEIRDSIRLPIGGLRILRQDPWDCTVGFILSAASNIPRIRGTMARLTLDDLGSERRLRRLGAGFRAPYLVAAERWKRRGGLDRVASLDDDAAREELMRVPGIARKVADCILLYAFGRRRAFPIDVWVRRALIRRYFGGRRTPDAALQAFAARRFGEWAGYAQQALFVAERTATRARARA